MAVILPFDDARPFSVRKIRPAIELARRRLERDQTLSESTTIAFHYGDSRCDSAHAINEAIRQHILYGVDVFLGPVCDYAVSSLARQCKLWNLPLVSCGAMARAFTSAKKSTFSTLTRVGPVNLHSLSIMFKLILSHFNWKHVNLLFEVVAKDQHMKGFCYVAMNAVYVIRRDKEASIQMTSAQLDYTRDYGEIFSKKISTDFADSCVNSVSSEATTLTFDQFLLTNLLQLHV
ncbi:atrial natriuretic peptide receptor 3-like [Gigantopelta aegis]|uniref:atrial natriuretic peptide receptor 3-like n=1 Tax=Gigantopelta aegis TaxID=1735272 RepID=UPI001B88BC1B|nr:atrial natriuretic peptide receptor 3-like [Gigantopelta aegis]